MHEHQSLWLRGNHVAFGQVEPTKAHGLEETQSTTGKNSWLPQCILGADTSTHLPSNHPLSKMLFPLYLFIYFILFFKRFPL